MLLNNLLEMGNKGNQEKKSKRKDFPLEKVHDLREKAMLGMEKYIHPNLDALDPNIMHDIMTSSSTPYMKQIRPTYHTQIYS